MNPAFLKRGERPRIGGQSLIAARCARWLVLILAIAPAAWAESACPDGDAELHSVSSPSAIGLIRKRVKSADYDCATRMMRARADALATAGGREGIVARFELRELALAVAEDKNVPAAARLELARQAAHTLDHAGNASEDEIKADVRLLVSVAKRFRNQKDLAPWLDALEEAIGLDQHLPDADRRLQAWEISTDPFSEAGRRKDYARLARLAALTRGDRVLDGLRSKLAFTAYFNGQPWDAKAQREEVIAQCHDLLELVKQLDDVTQCYGCVKEWRWRPIMKVGVAYFRLGMTDEAKATIDRALAIVRGIEKPDYRLGQLRFTLTELLASHYDRNVVLAVAGEMKALAESSETPIAKEVRKSLPQTMKRWGFREFQ
jgi:tetratricopeptide (TPR) repeat protein